MPYFFNSALACVDNYILLIFTNDLMLENHCSEYCLPHLDTCVVGHDHEYVCVPGARQEMSVFEENHGLNCVVIVYSCK